MRKIYSLIVCFILTTYWIAQSILNSFDMRRNEFSSRDSFKRFIQLLQCHDSMDTVRTSKCIINSYHLNLALRVR